MKIKIAYSAEEVDKALKLARACLAFFPQGTKTKHSDRHKPFLHIYIADENDGHGSKPDGSKPDGSKPDGSKPDGSKPDGSKPKNKKAGA